MKFLKANPKKIVVIVVVLIAGGVTLLITLLLGHYDQIMQAQGGHGILAFEFSFSVPRVNVILNAWGQRGREAARDNLLIDFFYMPAYASLFAGFTLLSARTHLGNLQLVGLWLVPAQILAAAFDALENVMLLTILKTSENVAAAPPLIAGISASIKFILLAVAAIYCIVSLIIWGIGRLRRQPKLS